VKRLLQILLNAMTMLSLLVCLASAVLWVRGYFVQDWWEYAITNSAGRRYTGYSFVSNRGTFYVSINDYRFKAAGDAEKYARHYFGDGFTHQRFPPRTNHSPNDTFWRRLGFMVELEYDRPDVEGIYSWPRAFIPNWFVMLISAILPAWWLIQARRWRKRKGMCPQCGYDMRATPQRCPECGMVAAETAFAAGWRSSGGAG
jgi:hypothetical protein